MSNKSYKFSSKTKNKLVMFLIYLTSFIMLICLIFGNIYIGLFCLGVYVFIFVKSPSGVFFYENEIRIMYVFIKKDINYDKIKKVKVYTEGVYSGSTISLVTDKKQISFDYGTDDNLCGILNFLNEKGLKIVTNKNLRELVNVDFQNKIVFTPR